MNFPKIHRLENGDEKYKCSKCKEYFDELKGIRGKEGKVDKNGSYSIRYKWICECCYIMSDPIKLNG